MLCPIAYIRVVVVHKDPETCTVSSEIRFFQSIKIILRTHKKQFLIQQLFLIQNVFTNQNVFAFNSKSARPDSQKSSSVQKKQFPFRNGPFRAILVHFGLILGQFGSKMFFRFKMFFCKKPIHRSARPGRTHKKQFEWKKQF